MQASERPEFEEQLAILCAGFNVPATNHRKHAYWTGLAKMSLLQFVRCVEFAVAEEGPDELPTSKGIWRIHRGFRRAPVQAEALQIEEEDHLLFFANRLYFRHLMNRGGVGSTGRFVPGYGLVDCKASPELVAGRKVVRDLVDWFSPPICEGGEDATPEAFIEALIEGLSKVARIDPRTIQGWREVAAHADAKKPFAPGMGRPAPARYERKDLTPA